MTANRTRKSGTKSTAEKSAVKKSSATRSTAKKSSGKKASTKKATTKKGSSTKATSTGDDETRSGSGSRSAPRAESRPRPGGREVAAEAARQLLELTGKQAEGVTGLERRDEGWRVEVEVVEVRRIPDTTDVLALYEVTTDDRGDLEGYRRLRRYVRGTPGEDAS